MRSAQREAAGWWPAAPTKGVSSMLRLTALLTFVLAFVLAGVAAADPAPAPAPDPTADAAATAPLLASPLPSPLPVHVHAAPRRQPLGDRAARYARRLLGVRYTYGGNSPATG